MSDGDELHLIFYPSVVSRGHRTGSAGAQSTSAGRLPSPGSYRETKRDRRSLGATVPRTLRSGFPFQTCPARQGARASSCSLRHRPGQWLCPRLWWWSERALGSARVGPRLSGTARHPPGRDPRRSGHLQGVRVSAGSPATDFLLTPLTDTHTPIRTAGNAVGDPAPTLRTEEGGRLVSVTRRPGGGGGAGPTSKPPCASPQPCHMESISRPRTAAEAPRLPIR